MNDSNRSQHDGHPDAATYRGYNTTGTSYTQAGTVSGDIVLTQSVPTYNEVGNVVSTATSDRLNSASTSTTGALTSSNALLVHGELVRWHRSRYRHGQLRRDQ